MPKISHLAQFSVKGGIKGGVHHPFTENMDVTGQTPWLIQQYCSSHQIQQIKCQSAPQHFWLHVKLWVNGWQSHNKPCWSGLNGAWLLSSLYSLSYHFNNAILRKGPDEPFLFFNRKPFWTKLCPGSHLISDGSGQNGECVETGSVCYFLLGGPARAGRSVMV